jgi:uncharacterized membrane protein
MRAVAASVLYLVLAHSATLTGRVELHIAAIVLLVVLLLAALRGLPLLQITLLAVVGGCLALADQPMQLMLYAPPVLFPLLLAGLFGRSLLAERQPLVERIVWHMHGQPAELSIEHRRYARGVTLYWCVVFVAMAVANLLLAMLAPVAVWSWIGNIAAYLMPLVALLAEYGWRKHVFPVQQYRNLFDYLARIVRLGPTLARDLGHDWRQDGTDGSSAVRS